MNINNRKAFKDMLSVSEGTSTHPLTKNDGYDVIVTGIDGKPEIFTNYKDHPFAGGRAAKVFNKKGERSSASGRYQQIYRYWPHYKALLKLPDFGPESQEKLALQLIKERRALENIDAGEISIAINKCCNIWASLPGAGYNQHEFSLKKLLRVYVSKGGQLCPSDAALIK